MQVTLARGTAPFVVGGENVQETVSTVVPNGCSTVMVALVNDRSVIFSVQFVFGQSGEPAMIVTGASVFTSKGVPPVPQYWRCRYPRAMTRPRALPILLADAPDSGVTIASR